MRMILILWSIPLIFFWGWYGLSAHDIHFGSFFLSRPFHDHMFVIYGNMLGVPSSVVPGMIAGTFAFDTLILIAIAAYRWRKSWYPQTRAWISYRFFGGKSEQAIALQLAIEKHVRGARTLKGFEGGSAHPAE